jgi:hypothetical protein
VRHQFPADRAHSLQVLGAAVDFDQLLQQINWLLMIGIDRLDHLGLSGIEVLSLGYGFGG